MCNTKQKKIISSFFSSVYFFTLLVTAIMKGTFVSVLWYSMIAFGILASIFVVDRKGLFLKISFLLIMIFTGCLNHFLIGNTSLRSQVLLASLFFISTLLMEDTVEYNVFLFWIYVNAVVVLYGLLIGKDLDKFYISASSNFVSVYLLYPAIIYYSLAEYKNKKIRILPALIIWILSIFARGRGGIISTSLFVLLLSMHAFKSFGRKKVFIICTAIIFISIIALNIDRIFNNIGSLEYMRDYGLKTSRFRYWTDYIEQTFKEKRFIFLGTDIRNTLIGVEKNGNPHNSLISIHINNGLFMLFMVLYILIKNGISSIRNHKTVYLACLCTMIVRAFTDEVFWPTYGSPILFFLLFYPNKFIGSIDQKDCSGLKVLKPAVYSISMYKKVI